MALPSLVVVHDAGSAAPLDVMAAAEGLACITFAVPADPQPSEHVRTQLPLLRELAPVVEVAARNPAASGLGRAAVDGVVTFSDDGIAACAAIAGLLGLASIGTEAAVLLRDKYAQRGRFQERGLRVPWFVVPTEATVAEHSRFPAVLKPRSGFGSRMTYAVHDRDDLAGQLSAAAESGLMGSDFILESLLEGDPTRVAPGWGDYLSVESWIFDGEVEHIGVSGRFPPVPPFRETGMVFPAPLSGEVQRSAEREAAAAIRALGIGHAVCHTEIKLTPAGPVVIEVNGRIGGLTDSLLCHPVPGGLVRAAMQVALGDREAARAELVSIRKSSVGYHFSMYPEHPGRILAVEGSEALSDLPGVESVRVLQQPGSVVTEEMGTFGETILVVGTAPNHDQALHTLRVARELVRITTA